MKFEVSFRLPLTDRDRRLRSRLQIIGWKSSPDPSCFILQKVHKEFDSVYAAHKEYAEAREWCEPQLTQCVMDAERPKLLVPAPDHWAVGDAVYATGLGEATIARTPTQIGRVVHSAVRGKLIELDWRP